MRDKLFVRAAYNARRTTYVYGSHLYPGNTAVCRTLVDSGRMTTTFRASDESAVSYWARQPAPTPGYTGARERPVVRDPYRRKLSDYFHSLVLSGRGDNARGRSLHVLHFLEFAWSRRDLPLNSYRPSRRPGAFLAMVFDLLGDASRGYTDMLLEGRRAAVLQDVGRRLKAPWHSFVGEVEASGFPRLAAVLDETLQAALRNPAQSGLPGFLRCLRLYMTPSQLALLDVRLLIGSLSVGEVLAHLRFDPPTASTGVEERHPVGGDLRKAIRASYDAPWRRAVEAVGEPDLVTFLAVFPVDLTAIALSGGLGADLDDFAVFYACVTDAKAPGRVWQAPDAYVGADEEARQHFAFLSARGTRESLSRRAQGLLRLGLSGTFPETLRHPRRVRPGRGGRGQGARPRAPRSARRGPRRRGRPPRGAAGSPLHFPLPPLRAGTKGG